MDIAGHRTVKMHEHYTPIDASEKQAAARSAFGQLRVLEGGKPETGDQTGDEQERAHRAPIKSSELL